MNKPGLLDYQQAVQNPALSFQNDDVLRFGTAILNGQGMPKVASGGFAATFQIEVRPNRYAVRCFHKHTHLDRNLLERYRHIDAFVRTHRDLGFLLDVAYRADGIMVQGDVFPTVRMPWIHGEHLGIWVEDWAEGHRDRKTIEKVRTEIHVAVTHLRRLGAAHGDLQHGNILVLPDHSIRLIDYDGIYLPNFPGELTAIEEGHRNYQHPGRSSQFDDTLDLFSAQVIDLSLRALCHRPALWDTYGGTGESLLFTARDFADPSGSKVFAELLEIPAIADQTRRLRRACEVDFAHVPAVLLGDSVRQAAQPAFVLGAEDVFAAEDTEVLRGQQGKTITVFGTIQNARVNVGRGKRDVALINLGDWTEGEFTIVADDQVAAELFDKYGRHTDYGARLLPALRFWRVAVTGTLELYEHRGKLVPQIALPRAGRLRNLSPTEFDELKAKAAQRRTAPSTRPRSVGEPTRTQPPRSDLAQPRKPTAAGPPRDPAVRQADRWAQLSTQYAKHPKNTPAQSDPPGSAPSRPPPVPPPRQSPSPAMRPVIDKPPDLHSTDSQDSPPLPPPTRRHRIYPTIWLLLPFALLLMVLLLIPD